MSKTNIIPPIIVSAIFLIMNIVKGVPYEGLKAVIGVWVIYALILFVLWINFKVKSKETSNK